MLLGEPDERIERLGHDKLSTFGIGREHDRNAWRSIVRQLVAHGLIDVDVAGHGGLSISPEGREFLREKPTLSLRVPPAPRARRDKVRRDKVRRNAAQSVVADADQNLFQALQAEAHGHSARAERAALCDLPRQDADRTGGGEAIVARGDG